MLVKTNLIFACNNQSKVITGFRNKLIEVKTETETYRSIGAFWILMTLFACFSVSPETVVPIVVPVAIVSSSWWQVLSSSEHISRLVFSATY